MPVVAYTDRFGPVAGNNNKEWLYAWPSQATDDSGEQSYVWPSQPTMTVESGCMPGHIRPLTTVESSRIYGSEKWSYTWPSQAMDDSGAGYAWLYQATMAVKSGNIPGHIRPLWQ